MTLWYATPAENFGMILRAEGDGRPANKSLYSFVPSTRRPARQRDASAAQADYRLHYWLAATPTRTPTSTATRTPTSDADAGGPTNADATLTRTT